MGRMLAAITQACSSAAIEERMQVKIFKSTSTEKIEQEVNAWLDSLDAVIVKTDTAVADRSTAGSASSQTVIVLTLWYEEPGAAE
jgi:hypothetical protein